MSLQEALLDALKMLRARDRTEAEIRASLARRSYEEPVVDAVIEDLTRRKLLSDARVVEQAVEKAAERRPVGKARLVAELDRRGVDPELAEQRVEALDERAGARLALERKFAPSEPWVKGARYLAGLGYDDELVREVVQAYFEVGPE